MCGVAGRFDPGGLRPDPEWHERADRRLAHRGPDGTGHYVDPWCELVHRRLALIDLSPTGAQPMANEDGGVYVVFNGEIYNHRELRERLISRGHCFRGTSDTEVLVHLYEERGAAMVEELRGLFAFAIYDRARRRVLLARDRFGIKPLYYAAVGTEWVFASEIKAILARGDLRATINRQACYDFLGLGYVPEPATAFREIGVVQCGTVVVLSERGEACTRYYELRAAPDAALEVNVAATRAAERIERAVMRQRVADVPVAALLSGGIDSSLVVAAYRRGTRDPVNTFNVRFPDAAYDETPVARAVAARYETEHVTLECSTSITEPDVVTSLLCHFDQPFADSSLLPMYLVSKAIRDQGIICVLSGDGGDEVFGGYAQFWRAHRLAQLARLPAPMRRGAALTGAYLSRWTQDWGRQLMKAVTLAGRLSHDSAFVLAGLANYLGEAEKESLVAPEARDGLLPVYRHFDGFAPPGTTDIPELSRRMTETLFSVGLLSDMLRKVDMMSMLAGIEVRVPLLDEDVVELGLTLPHRLKTDGQTGKCVLRAVAQEWLPPDVAAHPKHGFSIPLDVLATERFHQLLYDLLLGPDAHIAHVLRGGVVRDWIREFEAAKQGGTGGRISRGGIYQRVFITLALELWLREHALSW
jgi:asparagine synthase (glutamine-hydrolysing)